MLRKHLALLCAAVLLLLAACGCNGGTPSSTPSSSTVVSTSSTPESAPSSTPESTPSSTPESTPSSAPESTPSSAPESSTPVNTAPNSINGDAISSFTIVQPKAATAIERNAAVFLQDTIKAKIGVTLSIVTDDTAKGSHEILVGNTSRDASKTAAETSKDANQFIVYADGDHVALYGEDFLLAGAAYYLMDTYFAAAPYAANIPEKATAAKPVTKDAKNFIMLIGDGMGFEQTKLLEYHYEEYGTDSLFLGYRFPEAGSSVTSNYYKETTDSAAGGTALATGYKTGNGFIGQDYQHNPVKSLTELAIEKGLKTAVISTDDITGATPASFSAHANDRNDTADIKASQALLTDTLLRGGWNQHNGAKIREYLAACMKRLENDNGFFIMYEEGYIDKHCHNNDLDPAIAAVQRFNEAISWFMEYAMYHPDTLVLITADHETGGLKTVNGVSTYSTGNHTGVPVPYFAYGKNTDTLADTVENTDIAKFFAKAMGEENFGDPNI